MTVWLQILRSKNQDDQYTCSFFHWTLAPLDVRIAKSYLGVSTNAAISGSSEAILACIKVLESRLVINSCWYRLVECVHVQVQDLLEDEGRTMPNSIFERLIAL